MLLARVELSKPSWTLRNNVQRSQMFDVLVDCSNWNEEKRPTIRAIKQAVNAAAYTLFGNY